MSEQSRCRTGEELTWVPAMSSGRREPRRAAGVSRSKPQANASLLRRHGPRRAAGGPADPIAEAIFPDRQAGLLADADAFEIASAIGPLRCAATEGRAKSFMQRSANARQAITI